MGYAQAGADSSVETDAPATKTEVKAATPSTLAQIESMANNALF